MSARPRPARGQKRAARFESGTKRVSLQKKNTAMEGGGEVVKGVSRRIIVVDPPDPKVFEEAIFIVKEDFLGNAKRADALKEAQHVANDYIRGAVAAPNRKRLHVLPFFWSILGALIGAAALALIYYL